MSGILTTPWQKPSRGAQLNRNNPLARNLAWGSLVNEGAGPRLSDVSGNGNPGVMSSAAWQQGRFGVGPFIASGVTHGGDIADKPVQNGPASRSLSIWVNFVGVPTANVNMFGKGNVFTLEWTTDNRLLGKMTDSGSVSHFGTAVTGITLNTWHHAVLVQDAVSGKMTLYVDGKAGVALATASTMLTSTGSDLTIGNLVAVTFTYSFSFDLPLYWTRALTAAEARELYQNPFGMFQQSPTSAWVSYPIPPTGYQDIALANKPPRGSQLNSTHWFAKSLIACWLFNEGMGRRITDIGPHGYHINLGGTIGWGRNLLGPGVIGAIGNTGSAITTNLAPWKAIGTTQACTVAGWFTSNDIGNTTILFTLSTTGGSTAFTLAYIGTDETGDGGAAWDFNANNDVDDVFSVDLFDTLGKLYHVAAVYDHGHMYMYLDGVLVLSVAAGTLIIPSTVNAYVLADWGGNRPFEGLANLLSVHSRALTPIEILSLRDDTYQMIVKPNYRRWAITRSVVNTVVTISAALGMNGNLTLADTKVISATLGMAGTVTKTSGKGLTTTLGMAGTMVKTATKVLAGVWGMAGGLTRTTSKSLSGALGFAGVLARVTTKTLPTILGMAGSLLRVVAKPLTTTLGMAGSLVRKPIKVLAATLGMTGALTMTKIRVVNLSATLGFAGSLARTTTKTMLTTLGLSGSLIRIMTKPLTTTLGMVGTLARKTVKPLSATLGMAGMLVRVAVKPLTATLGMAGALIRVTIKPLTATLGMAGSLSRKSVKSLTATLGMAGTMVRLTTKPLIATLGMAGTMVRLTTKVLSTALGMAGSLSTHLTTGATNFVVNLAATLGMSGSLSRITTKPFSATLGMTASLTRIVRKPMTATLGFTGTLVRHPTKVLGAVLGLAGSLSTSLTTGATNFIVNLTATLGMAGSLTRTTRKSLSATLGMAGTIVRHATHTMSGVIGFSGSLARATGKLLSAGLNMAGALSRGRTNIVNLAGSLGFVGLLTRKPGKALGGTLGMTGTMSRRVAHGMSTSLNLVGTLRKGFHRSFTATLGFAGTVSAVWHAAGIGIQHIFAFFRQDATSTRGTLTQDATSTRGVLKEDIISTRGTLDDM